jgi:phage terminase small subunit
MAAKKLTIKQELFCQKYINCGNASEAYRNSYCASKMKPDTIKRKAFDVLHNGNVSATIENMKDDIKKLNLWTAEKSVKVLSEIAENKTGETFKDDAGKDINISCKHVDRISAVKELNSMHGFKSDTVIDLKSSDKSMSPKEITALNPIDAAKQYQDIMKDG